MNERIRLFKEELKKIGHPGLAHLTAYCLEEGPESFFKKPASSSGKYHPKSSLGEGGLARHAKRVFLFVELQSMPKTMGFSPLSVDIMKSAALLHDLLKYGIQDGTHTVQEHPQLASNFVESVYHKHMDDLDKLAEDSDSTQTMGELVETLCGVIEAHMGEWWHPEPRTAMQRFFHLCDYMASRRELEPDD